VTTTTPPNRPSSLPTLNIPPEKNKTPTAAVKDLIDEYFTLLRPMIHEFLCNPNLPNWMPPESVDNETRDFYNNLSIPFFNAKPSLLLHDLGNTPNSNVQGLFQDEMDVRLLRILCNTSGSGKTRLLFEGLCRHYGFCFVAAQGPDGIGARDLEGMIKRMGHSPGWVDDIFTDPAPEKVSIANRQNNSIASDRISKVLFARWMVFQLFIEVAKEIYGEDLNDDIKKRWLLFQILPLVRVGEKDPFLAFINICLVGVTVDVLDSLNTQLTPKDILGNAFDPPHNYFFMCWTKPKLQARNTCALFPIKMARFHDRSSVHSF
jgi:hypothetical protein